VTLGKEPTLIIQSVVLALNAIQISALSIPIWAHTLTSALVIGLGAILTRSQVTPA
jgi:hypothetical protein